MFELIVSIIIFFLCLLLLYYFYQGPAFVPTLQKTVGLMVSEVGKPGTKVADLGSGDGRIVIAFAQGGIDAVGFEINPLLAWYSQFKIKRLALSGKAIITTSNFWNHDLGEFSIVTVFGISHIMNRLGDKLNSELKPGAIVVSNAFEVPNLRKVKQIGSLLIYQKD